MLFMAFVGDEIDAEQHALDSDEIDVEQQDDTYDGDQEVEKSEDEYQDTNEFDNEDDTDKKFEEDLSMFRNENYEDEIRDKDVIYPDIEQGQPNDVQALQQEDTITVIEVDNNERVLMRLTHRLSNMLFMAFVGDEIDAEQHALDSDEIDVEQQDDTYDGDQEVEKSEDEYQDTNEFDNEDDTDKKFEEDLSMFRNENYEDEIRNKDVIYPDIEQSSGDEEEQTERMAKRGGIRWRF
ncbi:hypothetical protein F2Q68_00039007 [Brassica cretica]|uniref:Uncharacterized protein n=1 Tax=Brassica cretica TaxID=69181 RepID=A0A8S9M9R1_BRACR|nr:hypothetical protein F2Q68_00039007 [Brassica cretica]